MGSHILKPQLRCFLVPISHEKKIGVFWIFMYRAHARHCGKAFALGEFCKRWAWYQECLIRQVNWGLCWGRGWPPILDNGAAGLVPDAILLYPHGWETSGTDCTTHSKVSGNQRLSDVFGATQKSHVKDSLGHQSYHSFYCPMVSCRDRPAAKAWTRLWPHITDSQS